MSLGIESMSPADIAAVTGNANNNDGFGGNNGWWIILLLLALGGGWGNGYGMNGGANGGGIANGSGLYPWLSQIENTNDGFREQMMNDNITSIRDGIGNLATQLCNCCSDMQMAVANSTGAITSQLYNNTIADLERSFASQTATTQGMNAIQSQLAQCCCDNRLATNDLKYTIATENCADRAALSDGIRDLLTAQTASTQRILDQLCADKIDAKNDLIAQLRQELLYARGQASQDVQTARILAGQVAETDAIYNRLNECPVGTVPVYGRQPIFNCNNGCGCGCGNNF